MTIAALGDAAGSQTAGSSQANRAVGQPDHNVIVGKAQRDFIVASCRFHVQVVQYKRRRAHSQMC
jgi:hypothetical protein